jgi:outer membrane protein assembly factor BamE (lipoprotein component of BamABCDE complex)
MPERTEIEVTVKTIEENSSLLYEISTPSAPKDPKISEIGFLTNNIGYMYDVTKKNQKFSAYIEQDNSIYFIAEIYSSDNPISKISLSALEEDEENSVEIFSCYKSKCSVPITMNLNENNVFVYNTSTHTDDKKSETEFVELIFHSSSFEENEKDTILEVVTLERNEKESNDFEGISIKPKISENVNLTVYENSNNKIRFSVINTSAHKRNFTVVIKIKKSNNFNLQLSGNNICKSIEWRLVDPINGITYAVNEINNNESVVINI